MFSFTMFMAGCCSTKSIKGVLKTVNLKDDIWPAVNPGTTLQCTHFVLNCPYSPQNQHHSQC